MPTEVTDLAGEAMASCSVRRRYSRLPARPRTKATLAAHFGDEVEFDIYYLWSKPFALLIDVATRYVAFELTSREATDILQGIYTHWIRFFGPMKNFISDQETGLTGHHVAAEFERLGITRCS